MSYTASSLGFQFPIEDAAKYSEASKVDNGQGETNREGARGRTYTSHRQKLP